jgi:hypothetical protein
MMRLSRTALFVAALALAGCGSSKSSNGGGFSQGSTTAAATQPTTGSSSSTNLTAPPSPQQTTAPAQTTTAPSQTAPQPVPPQPVPAAQAVNSAITGGDNQTGPGITKPPMGAMPLAPVALPQPLQVTVTDQNGNPITNATVTFTVATVPSTGWAQVVDPGSNPNVTIVFVGEAKDANEPTGVYSISFSPGKGGANTVTAHVDVAGQTSPPDLTFTETGQ